jgi:RPA family protein
MTEPKRNRREVAWRIFAREYNASRHVINKDEEMSPSYVISPLGAFANRVFIAGVVTDIENAGSDNEPFWKVRISDPTGVFYLSAGQYQPEAVLAISKLRIPSYVCVLGKTRTYTPEGGFMYVSILPEAIIEIDKDLRDIWIMDTIKKTRERINCMHEALGYEEPSEETLIEQGFPIVVANGVMRALELYDEVPLEDFMEMLLDPLRTLTEGEEDPFTDTSSVQRGISEDEHALRKEILKLIEELDLDGEGAVYQDLIEQVGEAKIDRNEAEDCITNLLDDGHLFEPVLGRLKRV